MNYNQFTIDYIEAIKRNLNIEVNNDGEAIYFPDSIENINITNLKNQLTEVWNNAYTAIKIVKNRHDSVVQSGLFGLVDDLNLALKVGFLISDRVVILDYLYERILLKKLPDEISREHLGVIANSLVEILPLAQKGRVVILPTPFNWNYKAKKIVKEISIKTVLTPDLMSMLNMLSITKICHLHPYTIAESALNYSKIIDEQIDNVDVVGKDASEYAYEGILGALLSEKLLHETELKFALNVPIEKYIQVISDNKEFYTKYLSQITTGGSLNANSNVEKIKRGLFEGNIEGKRQKYLKVVNGITVAGNVGASAIAVFGVVSVISSPLAITGALLALSSTLTNLINIKTKEEDTIISVFKQLR